MALYGQGEINHSIASAQTIASSLADSRPIFVTGVPEGTQQNDSCFPFLTISIKNTKTSKTEKQFLMPEMETGKKPAQIVAQQYAHNQIHVPQPLITFPHSQETTTAKWHVMSLQQGTRFKAVHQLQRLVKVLGIWTQLWQVKCTAIFMYLLDTVRFCINV